MRNQLSLSAVRQSTKQNKTKNSKTPKQKQPTLRTTFSFLCVILNKIDKLTLGRGLA
jgi:hypothetical protein